MAKFTALSRKLWGPVLTPEAFLYDKWTIFNKIKLSKHFDQIYLGGKDVIGAISPLINLKRKHVISNQTLPKYI